MQAAASALNLPPQLLGALKELDVLSKGVPDAEGFWQRLAEQLERLEELAPELPPGVGVDDLAAWLAAGPSGHVLPEGGNLLPGPGEGSPLASLAALPGSGGPEVPPLREQLLNIALQAAKEGDRSEESTGAPLREQLLAMGLHAFMGATGKAPGDVSPEASTLHLPPQMLSASKELDVLPEGGADAEGFWQRVVERLERLEELAPELPPDITIEDLAAWLAAGPGGGASPEGGNPLTVTPGPREGSPLASPAALPGSGGPGGPPLREHLLHMALQAAKEGDRSEGFTGAPLREQLLAVAVHAVMDGSGKVPGGVSPGLTEGTERGLLELAALQARSAKGLQLGQAPVVTSGTAEAALPQLQTTGGLVLPRLLSLDIPLQQPGWDRSLGDRVQWMVNQNVQLAELKLNPPGLGPLEVRVRVDGDRTHISFLASQANVRDAVDAALPRLREMFAEGGVTLGDVTVGHRDGGDGRGGQGTPGEDGAGATDGKPDDAEADPLRPNGTRAGQGLVDYYA